MGARRFIGWGLVAAILSVAALVSAPRFGRADDDTAESGVPLPGHSAHGESFDTGPRRAPYLMNTTGDVHFPVSTGSSLAQKFFDQGIGQLHGFWYLEAERTFRQVAALDPDCAMAYWGMAMANINNAKRAVEFTKEAVKRETIRPIGGIESGWIDAMSTFYEAGPKDGKKLDAKAENARKKIFVDALMAMREKFPDDLELKAFSIFYIWEYKIKEENKTAERLLDEVLAADPKHPANHYRIHMLDGEKAKGALASAAMCGPAAPGIAHMWHMPGHTYSSLYRYFDAAWQQEASARTDHAYTIRDHVMPYEIHNYAHNNEWLIRDLVFVGRISEAIDLAHNMIELPRHPKYNQASNRGSGAEYGRARLTDVLALHQMWPQYLAECKDGYLSEDVDGERLIGKLRYLGVAYAAAGQSAEAQQSIAKLEKLRPKPSPATKPTTKPATSVAMTPTTKPVGNRTRRGNAAPKIELSSADQAIAHVKAEQAIVARDFAKAATLLTAANARKEHISQAYLAAGNTGKAIELAKKAVKDAEGQTYPLANQVLVLHKVGKKSDAVKAFSKLRDLAWAVDLSVEPYKSLGSIAKEYGFETDWRKPRVAPGDLGERPALDTLGPFRWHPAGAPAWAGTAADGSAISLADYRGRPVVVIFYLGHGCLHCTQQLHAFVPMAAQFDAAGISLVAISTDAPDSLNRAWEGAKLEGGEFPFRLASDASLNIFKHYGCFDDFEKTPLHGTFLIDGSGRIRWQDIAAEPFMDAGFLLKESKRLLAQHLR